MSIKLRKATDTGKALVVDNGNKDYSECDTCYGKERGDCEYCSKYNGHYPPTGNTAGRAYTAEGADVQRRKALVFLAGITTGKSYPEIKADYKEASC